jgi:hypothetical protein
MQEITNIGELQSAILSLEIDQSEKAQMLKEQFFLTYESLKPVNLLKSSLHDVVSSPDVLDDIIATLVGLATGSLSKKIVVGISGNPIRKLMGSIVRFGVSNFVSQHPDTIKSIGHFIYSFLLRKKETILQKP